MMGRFMIVTTIVVDGEYCKGCPFFQRRENHGSMGTYPFCRRHLKKLESGDKRSAKCKEEEQVWLTLVSAAKQDSENKEPEPP